MPFKQLWNMLVGSKEVAAGGASIDKASSSTQPVRPASNAKSSVPDQASKRTPWSRSPDRSIPSTAPSPKPRRRSILSMGGNGSDNRLLKQLVKLGTRRVLDIGIDNGARAANLIDGLSHQHNDLIYAVIDEFELSGGSTTLKDFHSKMKGRAVRPIIVPAAPAAGVIRVAHRLGTVDVILIGEMNPSHIGALAGALNKVMHAQTVIMQKTEDQWHAIKLGALDPNQRLVA
ncbi:MAG: hypothetical protein AAF670_17400 [Planctomycetota bacterium]